MPTTVWASMLHADLLQEGPCQLPLVKTLALAGSAQPSWLLCESHTDSFTGVRGAALAHHITWHPIQELAFKQRATNLLLF